VVSYRHWNMMEATYLINNIKERVCYVPMDFTNDLKNCKLYVRKYYFKLSSRIFGDIGTEREEETKYADNTYYRTT
jgi:hypothetical protein